MRVIISRNPDGMHVSQARFYGKWKHITVRCLHSLGTSNNLGSVIYFAVEPFHLSSSINRPTFAKVSLFMKNPNDRSFWVSKRAEAVRPLNSLSSIPTMLIFLSVLVGSSCQHQLGLHWLPYQPSDWWIDWLL